MTTLKRFSINFCIALIVLTSVFQLSFAQPSDIRGHWAEKTISAWVEKGLIANYPDGSFRPGEKVTRAMFAAMVNKIFGFTEKADISFPDVSEGSWYHEHISRAIKAGFMSGYEDGTFKPDRVLTRQEAAKAVCKAMKLDILGNPDQLARFTDTAMIEEEYRPYVNAVVAEGCMGGFPDGSFRPYGTLTRAEMVVLLDKAVGALQGSSQDEIVPGRPLIYTALGDSIAYGYGVDEEKGYVAKFYNHLKTLPGNEDLEIRNLSEVGASSGDLLDRLKNDENTRETVAASDVITVSIGGNNLLRPVIDSVCRAFDVVPGDYEDLPARLMLAMLFNPEREKILEELMEPENIPALLSEEVKKFTDDWEMIMSEIKALAPDAEVYAMTLYNPFPADPDDQLYLIFDGLVREANQAIDSPGAYYKVADVYPLFRDSAGDEDNRLSDFNLFAGKFDPHPTEKGHQVIYQAHLDAGKKHESAN